MEEWGLETTEQHVPRNRARHGDYEDILVGICFLGLGSAILLLGFEVISLQLSLAMAGTSGLLSIAFTWNTKGMERWSTVASCCGSCIIVTLAVSLFSDEFERIIGSVFVAIGIFIIVSGFLHLRDVRGESRKS